MLEMLYKMICIYVLICREGALRKSDMYAACYMKYLDISGSHKAPSLPYSIYGVNDILRHCFISEYLSYITLILRRLPLKSSRI